MTVGELDRKIDIYTCTKAANDFGEEPETFVFSRSVWAKLIPGAGGERLESKRETATNQVTFVIRYTALSEIDRIKYDGSYYDIIRIDEPDRKRYLNVTAQKKVA